MTTTPASASVPLADLNVGEQVLVKRVLDHPAWMKQIPCDPRNGVDTKLIRDETVVEELGASTVLDRREVPAVVGGWGSSADRPAKTLVRLPNGFWYDCATGLQDGSGATRIERAG